MSLGVGVGRDVEAHPGRAPRRSAGWPSRPGRRARPATPCTVAADLEQRHRVGVGAGAQLDVGRSVMQRLPFVRSRSAEGEAGRRRSSPAPEVWPTAASAAARRARRRCRARATYAANSGQHLAVQRAVEQRRGEQRGARRAAARTAASTAGWRTPAARCSGQPAAEHVVAERREPVAAADQRGRRVGSERSGRTRPTRDEPGTAAGGEPPVAESRGRLPQVEPGDPDVDDRPTTSGRPSRCRTPPRTCGRGGRRAPRSAVRQSAARTAPRRRRGATTPRHQPSRSR